MTDIACTSVLEKYRRISVLVPSVLIILVQLHSSLNGENIKLLVCIEKMNKTRLQAVHAWAVPGEIQFLEPGKEVKRWESFPCSCFRYFILKQEF